MSALSYPTPTSPLYEVATAFMHAANKQDWDVLGSLLADSFTHQIHPASLQMPGHEQRTTKQDYLDRAKMLIGEKGLIKEIKVSPRPLSTTGAKLTQRGA